MQKPDLRESFSDDGESDGGLIVGQSNEAVHRVVGEAITRGPIYFLPPGWKLTFITPVKCEYCGRRGAGNGTCPGCGAPSSLVFRKEINHEGHEGHEEHEG
ncbi:MAG: hypothetical protein WCH39_04800 [Schlesneria sp.]